MKLPRPFEVGNDIEFNSVQNKKPAPSIIAGTGIHTSCGATRLDAMRPLLCVLSYAGFDNEVPAPSSLLSNILSGRPQVPIPFCQVIPPFHQQAVLYKAKNKGTYTPSSVSTIKAQMSFRVKDLSIKN